MPVATEPARPPALGLYLTEVARGAFDLSTLPWAAPWLSRAPRGESHGVFVLPGLMATDSSTQVLRSFAHRLGYTAWGWRLGRNLGPRADTLAGMPKSLEALAEQTGGPVSIVGWSLGGVYGRELARSHPDLVRQVITLGSPFALTDRRQSRVDRTFRRRAANHEPGWSGPSWSRLGEPIAVPSTAVYSKRDGIVHWRSCIEPETDLHHNVQVRCAHLGFGVDPATLWLVADRLAQPAGAQTRFAPPTLLRALYPRG